MYYDTYRGKTPRRRRRRSCMGWLLGAIMKLAVLVLALAILALGLLYALPASVMNIEPAGVDLSLTNGLPGTRVNVLLLGLDFLDEGKQRSDAMIIASIGYDCVRLTSVMRDTMVEIPGQGRHKLNSAYSYGGADMVMRTINDTFDLDITNYVAMDLRTLVDLVDAVGGVDVDVAENEIGPLNHIAWDTFKKISLQDAQKYEHYRSSQPVTAPGEQHLDGLFATAYSRIRSSDSDYMRTSRQREVITAFLAALRQNLVSPSLYPALWDILQNSIQTNLKLPELISLGEKALLAGDIQSGRFPRNEHMTDDGSSIEITDPAGNVRSLHEFIYS